MKKWKNPWKKRTGDKQSRTYIIKKVMEGSRDEMISIDRNIARIKGALDIQDKVTAIVELSELRKKWNDLEK